MSVCGCETNDLDLKAGGDRVCGSAVSSHTCLSSGDRNVVLLRWPPRVAGYLTNACRAKNVQSRRIRRTHHPDSARPAALLFVLRPEVERRQNASRQCVERGVSQRYRSRAVQRGRQEDEYRHRHEEA